MDDQQVLCVPASLLDECGTFHGYKQMNSAYEPLFATEHQTFQPLAEVETDPAWKQLVTYVIVVRLGQILTYYRDLATRGYITRGKRAIGVGGHIRPKAADVLDGHSAVAPVYMDSRFMGGMISRLQDQLEFEHSHTDWNFQMCGLINDHSTENGRTRLGVVLILDLRHNDCHLNTASVTYDMRWHTRSALCTLAKAEHAIAEDRFEWWAQLCLADMATILPTPGKDLG